MNLRLGRQTFSPPLWFWAVALSSMLVLFASAWYQHSQNRAERASISFAGFQALLNASSAEPTPVQAQQADFTASLPASAFVDPVVRDCQRFSSAAGVSFVSVDASGRDATVWTLGRAELGVVIRGEYPKLKSVLGQVLDRYPNLVLQRLSLRRLAAPADVEATVNLLMLSKPKPASGSGS